ncbi:MAG: hypothetical protein AB7O28_01250 [Vicinamibacterales bacterium]
MKHERSILRTALAAAVACTVLLTAGAVAAQAPSTKRAEFTFKTAVMLNMSGYVLSAGEYTLERVPDTGTIFRLHRGPVTEAVEPLAVIDTWNTRWPAAQTGESAPADTEALVTIRAPMHGASVRSLEGFTVEGDYYKIRDVLAVDLDALTD